MDQASDGPNMENARLIATAPEMLEILQRMIDHGRRCNWFADRLDEELVSEAEALIEKATTVS